MATTKPVSQVRTENQVLSRTIQQYLDQYSTDDQKVEYQYAEIARYQNINRILLFLYYFLVLVLALFLYYTKIPIHHLARLALWGAVALFPFWIEPVESGLGSVGRYLGSFVSGDALHFATVHGNPPGVR